jgi:putative phosphoribosyl transferase
MRSGARAPEERRAVVVKAEITRLFEDRRRAGLALARELTAVIDPAHTVVAGIPRGGIAVAIPIVERFAVPLAMVYARKLTAPQAPELAFGALDEDGHAFIDPRIVAMLALTAQDIERARTRVTTEIRRRMSLYEAPSLAEFLPGRDVVLVDDGLATGLTMRAAVAYARRHGARQIIVAVPCVSSSAAERFRREADRLVSLIVDEAFEAVGAYYVDFSPVSDDEVVAMLRRARGRDGVQPLRISFTNPQGRRLAGELLLPDTPGPHPVVVFAHGFGSDKASPRNRLVADALVAAGVAAFVFDFTGHGESEGTPEDSTPTQQVDDLRAALDTLGGIDDVDGTRLAVAGASSGAAIALRLAAEDKRIRALALRSPNVEGAEAAAVRVKVPTLLVVGERDAPIRLMCEALLPRFADARLEIVPRGDHLFEEPEALARAAALTVGWLKSRLS